MHSLKLTLISLIAGLASAAPHNPSNIIPQHYLDIFKNPTIHTSIGGKAICISGTIDIPAAANNTLLDLPQPANQTVLTNLLVQFTQINSTFAKDLSLGPNLINETFSIYSELCFPKDKHHDPSTSKPLQFLIHGGHFGHTYWSPAKGYSYIDFAASRGYPTFTYDRLGVGNSTRPDPIQTVQTPIQVAIAYSLLTKVKGLGLEKIVGIGHSYGSAQLVALTPSYPTAFAALVLTGAVAEPNGQIYDHISSVATIASEAIPERFGALSNGYYVSGPISGLQYGFFRAPNFDPEMLELAQKWHETQTVGELLNFGEVKPSENFEGPVFVMIGEHDVPNCQGDCYVPHNKAATVKELLYPNASNGSGYHVLPGIGHGINYHYGTEEAYGVIHDFLGRNGL